MYALTHVVDFSNLLDIRLSEPLADEIDRQDETPSEPGFSPARELQKAVFGAA